jgi:hypothetical protein
VCALNLKRSPENVEFREWADPLSVGAGETEGVLVTSAVRHPGVSDSIELHNGRQSTQASDEQGLLGKSARQYPSMSTNVKRGAQMAASRVMGTGTPQRLAMRQGNAC